MARIIHREHYEAPENVVEAVDALMDVATRTETNRDGETFTECKMCGEWEGHHDDCPMPAIVKWWEKGPR